MFARFLRQRRHAARNGSRSRSLEVEALEGRSLPSVFGALAVSASDAAWQAPPGGSQVREVEPLGGSIIKIIVMPGTVEPNTEGPPPGTGTHNGLLGGETVDPNNDAPPVGVGGSNGLLGGETVEPNTEGPPTGAGGSNGLLGGGTVEPNTDGPPTGIG